MSGLVILGSCRNTFTMSVDTLENSITVSSSRGADTCDSGSCDFAYTGGASLTIRVFPTQNLADCLTFAGWRGACADQGVTCNLTINSNLSTSVIWTRLGGCIPR